MGSWFNNDGLNLKYGTTKAVANTAGDYVVPGGNRALEVTIDLSKLNTSTATILSDVVFFPAGKQIFIESVEVVAEVGMSTTSSPTLSVGIIGLDRSTVDTNGGTAFVKAVAASTLSTAGNKLTLVAGGSGAGDWIGKYNDTTTNPGYLTAILGTATATGTVKVRIMYHGVGTITQ